MATRVKEKAAARQANADKRPHATAKYVRVAPRKAKIVVDLIRGKQVDDALAILMYTPKSAAPVVEKLLNSAIANAEYKEMVHQRYVDEAQAMYDYLKEYGTYEQQKLAITKEYEEKIKNARSKGERLTLTRQRDSRIAQANSQSLAMNIDWSQTFKGLGNILKDIASETLAKVNEYMRTDEYKNLSATDKKSYQELREKLMSAGGQEAASPFKTSTWADIAKYTEEYKQRVKDLMLASQTHREAVQRLEDAQRDLERATTVTGKAMAQHQVDMAKKWVDETAQQVENSDSEKDKAKEKLHTATDAASEGLENLNTVIGQPR